MTDEVQHKIAPRISTNHKCSKLLMLSKAWFPMMPAATPPTAIRPTLPPGTMRTLAMPVPPYLHSHRLVIPPNPHDNDEHALRLFKDQNSTFHSRPLQPVQARKEAARHTCLHSPGLGRRCLGTTVPAMLGEERLQRTAMATSPLLPPAPCHTCHETLPAAGMFGNHRTFFVRNATIFRAIHVKTDLEQGQQLQANPRL